MKFSGRGSQERARSPRGRSGGGSRAALAVLVSLALVCLGCGVGAAISSRFVPVALQAPRPADRAPVSIEEFSDAHAVKVHFDVTPDMPISWKGGGTVTGLRVGRGDDLVSGQSPLSIDGVPVLALHTAIPFYRSMSLGVQGDDVSALRDELASLGLPVGRGDRALFDQTLRSALQTLQEKAGAPRDGVIDPDRVIWLPGEHNLLRVWNPRMGQGIGPDLGASQGSIQAMSVARAPESLADGSHVIEVFGKKGAVDKELKTTQAAFLRDLASTKEYADLAGSPDALEAGVDAELKLDHPVRAFKIPVGAVFGRFGQKACVQAGGKARPITILGSKGGFVMVSSDQTFDSVDLNQAITARTCGIRP